ncbi:class I SAM-dependent methyltransferase [Acaryochloris marina]|nr:class I SAM-dependent methyltransferase [Acaryochloris marina]
MANFQEIHAHMEFEEWAYQQGLQDSEKYLIETYLDKSGKTVEAGTGGGRILLAMQNLGFKHLYGFDYLTDFIDAATKNDQTQQIIFTAQNASQLNYQDCFFDNAIYLQQVVCYPDSDTERLKVLQEAYRILKVGGIAIFSVLLFDARLKSLAYSLFIQYIRLLRVLRFSQRSIQYLPSLQIQRQNNYSALLDAPPYMYWYKMEEFYRALTELNFEVIAMGTNHQVDCRKTSDTPTELAQLSLGNQLYCVCRK